MVEHQICTEPHAKKDHEKTKSKEGKGKNEGTQEMMGKHVKRMCTDTSEMTRQNTPKNATINENGTQKSAHARHGHVIQVERRQP